MGFSAQFQLESSKYARITIKYVCCIAFHVLQKQQNLGRRFGTSKMHLSPPMAQAAVRSKAIVLLLLTFCLLLLPLWESVTVLCFVVPSFMSILVLQSS